MQGAKKFRCVLLKSHFISRELLLDLIEEVGRLQLRQTTELKRHPAPRPSRRPRRRRMPSCLRS